MRYFDVYSVDKGTLFALYVFVISFIHQTFVLGLVYLITSQYDAKVSLFIWLWLVVNDRKFSAGTVFFSHTNQPLLLHEPATI